MIKICKMDLFHILNVEIVLHHRDIFLFGPELFDMDDAADDGVVGKESCSIFRGRKIHTAAVENISGLGGVFADGTFVPHHISAAAFFIGSDNDVVDDIGVLVVAVVGDVENVAFTAIGGLFER